MVILLIFNILIMTEFKRLSEQMERIQEMLQEKKRVFNVKETSRFTGFTERTIYKKTSEGTIPYYKQSGKLYFDREELEDWLLKNKGFSKDEISREAATYNLNEHLKNI